jgi:glycosyltransferase involved in cell wall biosynthesis
MKILHVREVANVAATLADGMNILGHQAEVKHPKIAGGKYPLPIKAFFLPHRILEGADINRYVKNNHFDVVHIHMAYMGLIGIAGRYEYFLHCHGHDLDINLYTPFLRWATVTALRKAKRVYYSTPDLWAHVKPIRSDAVFIPNPINTENFRPVLEAQTNSGPPKVLLISRLWDRKGIDVAIDIVKGLKKRVPAATIDAFSWGPELGRFRSTPELSFISTVPYSEMPALINKHDIVIGQFKLGIMSMSELESMACGKPVVSYFKYPEFYDEPPPLYSAQDASAAMDYLVALCENPQMRKETGERGREWVVERHDFRKSAKTLIKEYETYATSQGTPTRP